ncbi:MAG: hypothetical protein ACP5SB_00755 [Caldisericaceae bacterium]
MQKDEDSINLIISDLFDEKSPDLSSCDSREMLSLFDIVLLLKEDEQFDPLFKKSLEIQLEKTLRDGKEKSKDSYYRLFWKSILQVLGFIGINGNSEKAEHVGIFEDGIDASFIKAYSLHALNLDTLLYNYSSVGYWFPKSTFALQ